MAAPDAVGTAIGLVFAGVTAIATGYRRYKAGSAELTKELGEPEKEEASEKVGSTRSKKTVEVTCPDDGELIKTLDSIRHSLNTLLRSQQEMHRSNQRVQEDLKNKQEQLESNQSQTLSELYEISRRQETVISTLEMIQKDVARLKKRLPARTDEHPQST